MYSYYKTIIVLKLYLVTIKRTNSPSLKLPFSAAWPVWNMVFTNIPRDPLGESLPPTMLNPKDLCPGPLWRVTVNMDKVRDLGRGVWLCLLGASDFLLGETPSNWQENFLIPVTALTGSSGGMGGLPLDLDGCGLFEASANLESFFKMSGIFISGKDTCLT